MHQHAAFAQRAIHCPRWCIRSSLSVTDSSAKHNARQCYNNCLILNTLTQYAITARFIKRVNRLNFEFKSLVIIGLLNDTFRRIDSIEERPHWVKLSRQTDITQICASLMTD